MVFSSLYLDPENNWHQQANQHQLLGINENFHQFQPPPPPPPTVSTRAGPIADRAHLAKITQPETPLKCPRCDSIDTKFCYFNNYSLSQPRHFCKTCRRYWTRGGALRNVPVGGGYRRNKRKRRTKSPVNASTSGCSTISGFPSSTRVTDNMLNDLNRSPQLPLLPPLHFLGGYSSSDVGLSFGGSNLGYQIGMMSSSGVDQPSLSSGIFPFLGNLETVSCELQGVLEQEQLTSYSRQDHQLRAFSKQLDNISGDTQLAPVKREGNHSLNLSKNVLGVPENDQIWNGNAWRSDLFGYASSATNHLL